MKQVKVTLPEGFNDPELRSLKAAVSMVKSDGGIAYVDKDLYRTSRVINNIISKN